MCVRGQACITLRETQRVHFYLAFLFNSGAVQLLGPIQFSTNLSWLNFTGQRIKWGDNNHVYRLDLGKDLSRQKISAILVCKSDKLNKNKQPLNKTTKEQKYKKKHSSIKGNLLPSMHRTATFNACT